MSTLSFGAASPATGIGRNRVSAALTGFFAAVGDEWRARRATRSVESLSDDMLHDIGIARGEIDRAVRYGRGRR